MNGDKDLERNRYDSRANLQMSQNLFDVETASGSRTMVAYLQAPYLYYEQKIRALVDARMRVLELGAGSGTHTHALLETGASVTVSDISQNSLALLRQRYRNTEGLLESVVADMENLPFDSGSFDVVASAGSLSYGEPKRVDSEIRRVLRPGGMLICVDSFNHNPIYRFNRWLHYLRGNRTKSTLKHMPDLTRIQALEESFIDVQVKYFGALTFAMPLVARCLGESTAKSVSDRFDRWIDVKRSAFKFVLVAHALS